MTPPKNLNQEFNLVSNKNSKFAHVRNPNHFLNLKAYL